MKDARQRTDAGPLFRGGHRLCAHRGAAHRGRARSVHGRRGGRAYGRGAGAALQRLGEGDARIVRLPRRRRLSTQGRRSLLLTADTAMFLDRNSPAYMGGVLEFLHTPTLRQGYANLTAAVRKGGTAVSADGLLASGKYRLGALRALDDTDDAGARAALRAARRSAGKRQAEGARHRGRPWIVRHRGGEALRPCADHRAGLAERARGRAGKRAACRHRATLSHDGRRCVRDGARRAATMWC